VSQITRFEIKEEFKWIYLASNYWRDADPTDRRALHQDLKDFRSNW
jgi:hypothetical protein